MRKLFAILAAGAMLTAGGHAQAASVSVNAVMAVQVAALPPISLTGSGTVDITGGVLTIGAGLVTLGSTLSIPITTVTSPIAITATSNLGNLAGVFSVGRVTATIPGEVCGLVTNSACVGGGSLGGVMGLTGTVKVNVGVPIPVNLNSAGVGQGGAGGAGIVAFEAAPWTTGTGKIDANGAVSTASGVGPAVTASGLTGPLTLVTPTFVAALGTNFLPIVTTLTLTAVPEPGSLLLVGAGIAGLALLGSRRK